MKKNKKKKKRNVEPKLCQKVVLVLPFSSKRQFHFNDLSSICGLNWVF
jgi:hypothetical protein